MLTNHQCVARNRITPSAFAVLLVFSIACIIGLTAVWGIGDEKSDSPKGLDAVSSATARYLPVVFKSHDKHAKELAIACTACHHDAGKDEKPKACSACHNKPDAKVDLKAAMHKSCRGCHLSVREKNKDSRAPVDCLGCHTERK